MTKDETLKLALEALEEAWYHVGTFQPTEEAIDLYDKAKTALREALAQEQDNAYIYASNLATAIWQKHYIKESPKFELLDTTEGVLTQIDNMTCGLVREKPAQPKQEPVAWISTGPARMIHWTSDKPAYGDDWIPLYTTPPQRTWVGLTEDEVQNIVDCGRPTVVNIRKAEQLLKDKNI